MGKSPVLVVNKIDEPEKNYSFSEFGKLGFKNVVSVSAEHGHGVENFQSLLLSLLPDPPPLPDESEESRTRIAFIGRPNVGNHLCVIAYSIWSVLLSVMFREPLVRRWSWIWIMMLEKNNETWKFRLFDTAGLKKKETN